MSVLFGVWFGGGWAASDQSYVVAAKMPLAWLLQTKPADHQIGG